jgi:hypothetical protein
MISLRTNLKKIGITPPDPPFSYRSDFVSRPSSLREAIRSMDAPENWQETSNIHCEDCSWTDEGPSCNNSEGDSIHHD